MTVKLLPVSVTEIVGALEREANNTDTDPRWLAATALRAWSDWDRRTLMCRVDIEPGELTVTVSAPQTKEPK